MIYVHLGFFLCLLLIFYTCKGKKKENLKKKSISEETKGRMKYMWEGEGLLLNIGIEEQQNYYEQWGK